VADYALVQAGFGAPVRQNRWKVAFRFILVIPLELWLIVLSLVATILMVIGWFAALVMGRLPHAIARFLSDYIVYVTRMYSYVYLMNDAYPPFSAKKEFGVNVDIPVSKVRRWAVLFRAFMLIPASIVLGPVSVGLGLCGVFIWLIVLVKGEMPLPLYGATAAVLRFEARVSAYALMLTGKYPGELFGEKALVSDAAVSPVSDPSPYAASIPTTDLLAAATEPTPEPISDPASESSTVAASAEESPVEADTPPAPLTVARGMSYASAPAPTGKPVMFAAPGETSTPAPAPRTARLVLSRGSKRILVAFLIVGILGYGAYIVVDVSVLQNEPALVRLTNANALLNTEVASAKATQASCTLGQTACNHEYFTAIFNDFHDFQITLEGTSFPSSAQADANRFENTTGEFVALLYEIKIESSITADQVTQLDNLGNAWDTDLNQVMSDLSSPI
jgi:hypothetical protein